MSDIDFERAATLLGIVKAVSEHGGMYQNIGALANTELADMNVEAGEELKALKDAIEQEKADREEKEREQAKVKAKEDAISTSPRTVTPPTPTDRRT